MSETWTPAEYQHYINGKKQPGRKPRKNSKAVGLMKLLLDIEEIKYVEEYKFCDTRKFRFDFAIPEKRIAIEFEGLMSKKSRHTTVTGYSKDCEKYNLATTLGWRVLRYTILSYGNLIKDVQKILNSDK